jgi:hypothetical protein
MQVWEPEAGKPALKLTWNFFGVLTCVFYWAATVYYFYVRFAFTMDLGITAWCVHVMLHSVMHLDTCHRVYGLECCMSCIAAILPLHLNTSA